MEKPKEYTKEQLEERICLLRYRSRVETSPQICRSIRSTLSFLEKKYVEKTGEFYTDKIGRAGMSVDDK